LEAFKQFDDFYFKNLVVRETLFLKLLSMRLLKIWATEGLVIGIERNWAGQRPTFFVENIKMMTHDQESLTLL